MYVEARTYIIIEIALEKPLVPKTSPEELARRWVLYKSFKYHVVTEFDLILLVTLSCWIVALSKQKMLLVVIKKNSYSFKRTSSCSDSCNLVYYIWSLPRWVYWPTVEHNEMCLFFLQGEGVDPTQTSTSTGS